MIAFAAGKLDRRISIQIPTVVRDASGGFVESFATQYANVPAQAVPFTGREKYKVESAREMTYRQVKFMIRYIAGITTKNRIVYEGENYDILFIADLGRREMLEILAQVAK